MNLTQYRGIAGPVAVVTHEGLVAPTLFGAAHGSRRVFTIALVPERLTKRCAPLQECSRASAG